MDGGASDSVASPEPRAVTLRSDQLQRYARHLCLSSVGPAGQRLLLDARVLVVGAGGLGVPVLQYLAAAGVGTITVVDDDTVQLSNLQRQICHRTVDVGVPKVESARRALHDLNPDVVVHALEQRLSADNVVELCSDHDVVVDATDNFGTRFLLNDACVLLGLPLVWAAINQFDGQLTVWSPGQGPCLRCLFPTMPDAAAVPSCAAAGVLGVLPGLLGAAQAAETLKLLLGIGEPLIGRLAVFDALAFDWSTIPMAADPACPVCSKDAAEVVVRDESPVCEVTEVEAIAPADVAAGLRAGALRLIDVRTAEERAQACIDDAEWLLLDDIRSGAVPQLDDRALVVMCRSGVRSTEAVRLFGGRGVPARSMDGGIIAWAASVDPELSV